MSWVCPLKIYIRYGKSNYGRAIKSVPKVVDFDVFGNVSANTEKGFGRCREC